jgi:hypothetical protein
MAPGTLSLAGSSLPARRKGKAGSRDGITDTADEPCAQAREVAATAEQYHGYLEWLQKEVLDVLDEVQCAAGRGE